MTREIFEPPTTRPGRRRRRRTLIAMAIAIVIAAAGLVWVTDKWFDTCGPFWSGIDRVEGECVGVTDGSYHFQPEFANVEKKIAQENEKARNSASYVTVALLDLLTPNATSATSAAGIRNELEGAYTAQHQINESGLATSSNPRIQLVLANQGDTDGQWQPVADQLVEMTTADHPLVAVIGLGVSTAQTRRRAQYLSNHEIPMVGAIITADGLDHTHIPGLIRVSASNRDYVKALRGYLDSRKDLHSAVLVYDTNSDSGADLFTMTLKDDLEQQMQDLIGQRPPQPFVGASIPGGGSSDEFGIVTPNICSVTPDVVFYAGRERDLPAFLQSLEGRLCRDKPLTVVTGGDDLGELLKEQERYLSPANLTVVFAGTTYAEGWKRGVLGTPPNYPIFLSAFRGQRFDDANLDDGGAIMMYDALQTAEQAVQLAAQGELPLTAAKVRGVLLNLNGEHVVQGASGTFSFSPSPTGAGNPHGKPVPVLQFPPPPKSLSRQVGPLYMTP